MEPVLPEEPDRFRSPEYLAARTDAPPIFRLRLPEEAAALMRREAERAWPAEACGLLVGTVADGCWRITQARTARNLNTERAEDRFALDPAAWRAAERELRGSGLEIIGVWHSHPDCPAKPSPTDLESAWEGLAYPIVAVHQGRVTDIRAWHLDESCGRFREMFMEVAA
ncbi:MAG: M67 family metallopeptidase [Mariprofundaceae bacterium]